MQYATLKKLKMVLKLFIFSVTRPFLQFLASIMNVMAGQVVQKRSKMSAVYERFLSPVVKKALSK